MKPIGIVCTEFNVDKNGYKQKVNMVSNAYIEMLTKNDAIYWWRRYKTRIL